MKAYYYFISALLMAFAVGVFATTLAYSFYSDSNLDKDFCFNYTFFEYKKENRVSNEELFASDKAFVPVERESPADRISENQIRVYQNMVVLDIKDAEWASFADTNSMDPVIDKGANAIQIIPKNESEIKVGDIVSYKSDFDDNIIIHRVSYIGYDEKGWYMRAKGDNNPAEDPGKIRFSQIRRVVVAIIY